MSGVMPSTGDLTRRIKIRLWSDVPNAAFGLDQVFDAGINRWAKVEPVHGLAIKAGMNTDEIPTHLFWVRCATGTTAEEITTSHVVEFNGRRYRVMDTINVDDADLFTRITAKDLGAIV